MDRESALKVIKENVKNENLVKHMLATEAIATHRRFDPNSKKAISESNFLKCCFSYFPNSHYISIGNKHNPNLHSVAKISLTQDRNSYSSTM